VKKIVVDYVERGNEMIVAHVSIIHDGGTVYNAVTLLDMTREVLRAEGYDLEISYTGKSIVKYLPNGGRYDVTELRDDEIKMIKEAPDLHGLSKEQFDKYVEMIQQILKRAVENDNVSMRRVEYEL